MNCFTKLIVIYFFIVLSQYKVSAQSCESSQFSKIFSSDGNGGGGYADTLKGGGFIVANYRGVWKALMKTDAEGNFLWAKQYNYEEITTWGSGPFVQVDTAGNFLIDVNGEAVALVDPAGDVISMKEIRTYQWNGRIRGMHVLPDNKKLIFLTDPSSYLSDGYLLTCLSEDLSTVVWTKYLHGYDLEFSQTSYENNTLFLAGRQNNQGVFISINTLTGTLEATARYNIGVSGHSLLHRIYPVENGFIVTALMVGSEPPYHQVIMKLDENLNVNKSYSLGYFTNQTRPLIIPDTDGGYLATGNSIGVTLRISSEDNVLWSRFAPVNFLMSPTQFFRYKGGLIRIGGGNWNLVGVGPEAAVGIAKSDENGQFACQDFNINVPKSNINVVKNATNIILKDTSLITLIPVTPVVTDITYRISDQCGRIGQCSSMYIDGPSNICGLGTYNFTVKRNSGCSLPTKWNLLPAQGYKYEIRNDSSISINFTLPGNYMLAASLGDNCMSLADTMHIIVSGNTTVLDLGPPDSSLCAGNTIMLSAGNGFLSYTWQDGSTQPTLLVTTPGQYYVTSVSVCGTVHSDTININAASPVSISLGSDRIKCNDDTLHLMAPPGFLNYSWGNNYNINTISGQSVVVNPLIDTSYFVKAEKTPGCFGYDTVSIKVNRSPAIFLGADTSICAGKSLLLDAGPGFSVYNWSNGMNTTVVSVSDPGTYTVMAATSEGCRSFDSISLKTYSLPVPTLDKNTGLCKGDTRTFFPGLFADYLWQDGRTTSTFTATGTGVFNVKVTDVNGCIGNDTVRINILHEIPSEFLPSELAICNYGSEILTPKRPYEKYLWSNGARTPSIVVKNSGFYWLQVQDSNGCKGADSIIVQNKNCMAGIYIPSAFTPNGDNKNDYLKAMVFGDIQFFEFTIFNRYGQLVFTSKDSSRGWDGSFKGIKQETGNFVWICRYKINNEAEKTEKGSSLLLR